MGGGGAGEKDWGEVGGGGEVGNKQVVPKKKNNVQSGTCKGKLSQPEVKNGACVMLFSSVKKG